MENLVKINKFIKEEESSGIKIVVFGDGNYHYARKISNSRFGHMPAGIAYCKEPMHVQRCLHFCREEKVPFRIRSGGHQHEGMSSKNDALIIDLSEMNKEKSYVIPYKKRYNPDPEPSMTFIKIDLETNTAWISPGMKLQIVYNDLAKVGKVIPGGGCQSVNVGGLTQGGGWGWHVRKYGLTCDSLLDVEMVKGDGELINTEEWAKEAKAAADDQDNEKAEAILAKRDKILWALRGGGGGSFGVVTWFKFALSDIGNERITFGIQWSSSEDKIKKAITRWVAMHQDQDNKLINELSCSASMSVSEVKKGSCESKIIARVGGRFYGKKADLFKILLERFGDEVLPMNEKKDGPLMQNKTEPFLEDCFTSWNPTIVEEPKETGDQNFTLRSNLTESAEFFISAAGENQSLTDFISGENNFNLSMGAKALDGSKNDDCKRNYTVLPKAPAITCDAPHPHKVTSTYPKYPDPKKLDSKELVDKELIDIIYQKLSDTKYFEDVRHYMVWHCLGGKMTDPLFKKTSSFAYRDKPYMLQLQCWWNNSGKLQNDEPRSIEYVNWVNEFRESLDKQNLIEGSFINFVDREVKLEEYYGENFGRLKEIKKKYDPRNTFNFKMSIPPAT